MKSAFELALERSGGALEEISENKKELIAQVDSKYKSKEAEAKLAANERRKKAIGNPEILSQIEEDLAVELASIKSKAEQEKSEIRGD
jgi:hypothetical protein